MGAINAYDLRDGLNALGIYPTQEECDLFVRRYDKNHDGRLAEYEFRDAFLAHDAYYSSMVNRRPTNYCPRPLRREDVFLPHTVFEFQSMMRTHLRVESAADSLRYNLQMKPSFNAYEAFNSLDLSSNGSISVFELKRMLESRGYFVGHKEVQQVVDKFDRNKDGRITFDEFREETLPKSPARR